MIILTLFRLVGSKFRFIKIQNQGIWDHPLDQTSNIIVLLTRFRDRETIADSKLIL